MDFDRKSGTSSFYNTRRGSGDALNRDFPSPQYPDRNRLESTSTYNGPPRASADAYATRASSGYNSDSFMAPGRTEPVKGAYDEEAYQDEPFDIYADFNNEGPRYSKAVFSPDNGYRPVHSPGLVESAQSITGPVEMITVPALGPEWKAEELGGNRKRAAREAVSARRSQKWKEWRRGERGMCGKYFTRKFLTWFMFALCVAVGLVLAFVLPRVPGFQFNADEPLAPASSAYNKTVPTYFNRAPTNFSFPGAAQLQLDTGSNFITSHMRDIQADVYDLQTSMHIGTGFIDSLTLPAKQFIQLQLPLNFSYSVTNTSDITWNNWYNGCRNAQYAPNGKRPTVSFRLILGFSIDGLIGTKHAGADVATANCPVELPADAP
ncbi:hypothetical protein BC835DRAFT_1335927 [Cytidiella melzeri]|nr:hypothetical protein BC835DRAFT_1335927 [Cytidiella melzeri]